jgi:hypothetical protein
MKRITSVNTLRTRIDSIRSNPFLADFKKWRDIGQIVLADLARDGNFLNTPASLFLFDKECRRLFRLDENVELAAVVNHRYGINPKDYGFKRVLADLQSHAVSNGRPVEVRRLAHYDQATSRLYVSKFNGEMYMLDGNLVSSLENGANDVFFLDDLSAWESYSYIPKTPNGELDKQLFHSTNFIDSNLSVAEQRVFLKLWVMAVFFGNVQPTKIILLLLGEQGSGKTSALRRIQKLIFGPKANLLSIEKDKQDGFIATITADPIALFDNLDEQITWLPYALSRLATGVTFSRRKLYTTNDKVEFPGVSWLGITARTVRFMENQPDLPDRTLVLKLGRLLDRQPEDVLLQAVAQRRNALWSELLDELNAIVAFLRDHPEPVPVTFRMADFANFALKVGELWGCRHDVERAFSRLEGAQADVALERDPIHQVLGIWLRDEANMGRALDAGTLHREWSQLATEHRIAYPFGSGRGLGQALSQLRFALRERFDVEVNYDAHAKQNLYAFGAKSSEPEPAQPKPNEPAESEELVEEIAGFAGIERG